MGPFFVDHSTPSYSVEIKLRFSSLPLLDVNHQNFGNCSKKNMNEKCRDCPPVHNERQAVSAPASNFLLFILMAFVSMSEVRRSKGLGRKLVAVEEVEKQALLLPPI